MPTNLWLQIQDFGQVKQNDSESAPVHCNRVIQIKDSCHALERNYPSSRKEFLVDQGERPGTRTFQPFVRNPTFQREQTDIRAPPPSLNPEFTSVNRSQPDANVSRSSTTNAGFMSFSHSGNSLRRIPATNPEFMSFQREQVTTVASNRTYQTLNI